MTTQRDPDRLIHAFLAEGQTELADQVFDAVRASAEHERQRVVIGPWRLPTMNKLVPIGLGTAALVVALIAGTQLLGSPSSGGAGGAPSATPTPTPVATPAPSVAVTSPSAVASPPPLTQTLVSERNGITFSYPAGWQSRLATEPWTSGLTDFYSPAGDVVSDPVLRGDLWIAVASQPLGDSTPEAWVARTIAFDDGCITTAPVTIDGASGLVGTNNCARAAVTTDGRGYFIWLYTGGNKPALVDPYDQAWFDQVLATIQLRPEDAVDAAPSPSS